MQSPNPSLAGPSLPGGRGAGRGRLLTASLRTFRIALALYGLGLLTQAVLAGQLLEGGTTARTLHGNVAVSLTIVVLVTLIAAIVVWRSRGPWLPALLSLILTVGTFVQVFAGIQGDTAVHVPLAIVLVGLTAALGMWSRSAPGVR